MHRGGCSHGSRRSRRRARCFIVSLLVIRRFAASTDFAERANSSVVRRTVPPASRYGHAVAASRYSGATGTGCILDRPRCVASHGLRLHPDVLLDAARRRRSPRQRRDSTPAVRHATRDTATPRIRRAWTRSSPSSAPRGRAPCAPVARSDDRSWRGGLRSYEALALNESDLDRRGRALLVRHGKGGHRRKVGVDEWAWNSWSPGLTRASSSLSVRCSA